MGRGVRRGRRTKMGGGVRRGRRTKRWEEG